MIPTKQLIHLSKFLSRVLRHRPGSIGITLDKEGWTDVEELITKSNQFGKAIDLETLEYIVENNDKKRFALSPDKKRIRASQGHSVNIDLGYKPQTPPPVLYHGTGSKFVASILQSGLRKKKRHHVHLSPDEETARKVGGRHGPPVIFEVQAMQMQEDGHEFFISDNGVWLTDQVPPQYLSQIEPS